MARPEWCISFNCPNSPGYSTCHVNKWIIRGWPGNRKDTREIKKSLHEEYASMARKQPDKLIQTCAEKSFDLR